MTTGIEFQSIILGIQSQQSQERFIARMKNPSEPDLKPAETRSQKPQDSLSELHCTKSLTVFSQMSKE